MFDIISTAKNTQWSSFPTLFSKYTHSHVANEAVDFQVIPGKNCFVEFNKKFGFELMRTRLSPADQKEVIQRIKKRQVDDILCGAISTSGGQISIGLTTGFIRLFNVQSSEYVPIKFKPDRLGNSVVGLDYSNTDEHLAAVYDSADINLFGLKTGIKIDTYRLTGMPTLVRFHPIKQFALAVGSYEGEITMLDIQTKKKLFIDKKAHDAPIRDISMYASSQDLFVSCGYDCNINVFDLRKRSVVQQHKQSHPMSTVCVSSCGTFCVAGNLKGDVISYDFRSMKEPLDTKRLHDSAVVRVAFVPSINSASNMTLEQTADCTNLESFSTAAGTSRLSLGQDSFAKFVDVCHYNNVAAADLATPKRRDSWADLMPTKKFHDYSMDSMATPSRISFGSDILSDSTISVQSRQNRSMGQMDKAESQRNSQHQEIGIFKPGETKEKPVIEPKRRRLTEKIKLEGIEEEGTPETDGSTKKKWLHTVTKKWLHTVNHKEFADTFAAYVRKEFAKSDGDDTKVDCKPSLETHAVDEEDKENCQNNQQSRKSVVASPITDTPTRRKNIMDNENGEMIMVRKSELNQLIRSFGALEMKFGGNIRKWQHNVKSYMDDRLHELTREIRYMQGRYFHSDFNHRFVNHMDLEAELDLFNEGFASLLHLDSVQAQYPVYAAELEHLRRQFHEQSKFNHH